MIDLKRRAAFLLMAFAVAASAVMAQQKESMYGEAAKADVKLDYVYTLEDAFKQSRQQKKPIFFNCFADWALPCHGMNKLVFSDQEMGEFMNRNFVNLFMDLSEKKNSSIADRFKVKSFAHYLVLDADGNILLRITRGMPKEEFKEAVSRALNPKTTLPGSEKIYRSGKRGKKELLNYLNALNLAGEDSLFSIVNKEYMAVLPLKEYARAENWMPITSTVDGRDNPVFNYIVEHKADFVKNNGEEKVNNFLEGRFYWDLMNGAMGKTVYDPMQLADLYVAMQKADLPESGITYKIYNLARMRGQKDYIGMIDYMKENEESLSQLKPYIDTSLDIPEEELNSELRETLIAYFSGIAEKAGNSGLGQQMRTMIYQLQNKTKGIDFSESSFSEVLAKAKAEGKAVFIDCYTSWCGPCRWMASEVFTNPRVAEVFNTRFINMKIDMEKGEGPELAKRFDVTAFPTLVFVNSDGEVMEKNVGALTPTTLLEFASKIK